MGYISDNWLEILGTITGVVYLCQELKASIWMWVTGIIMPAISIFVYYGAGLYADLGINVYYLLAAVYGLAVWRFAGRRSEGGEEMPITKTPAGRRLRLALTFLVSFVCIGCLLQWCTDSTVPWWDSLTTAMSIVGLWMLARKWIEQWWVWVAVDVISCGLYIYKGIFFYSALYGLYAVVAVYGYFKWRRMMLPQ